MPKKVDRNKKNARTKEDSLALPYEAARAFNATGEETDPLGSWTGNPTMGRKPNAPSDKREQNDPDGIRREDDNPAQNIILPPYQRPPQGDIQLPGVNRPTGNPYPDDEPIQRGVPGGKTYLNVKSTDAEAPVQDADDL